MFIINSIIYVVLSVVGLLNLSINIFQCNHVLDGKKIHNITGNTNCCNLILDLYQIIKSYNKFRLFSPDQLWGNIGIVFTHSYSIFNHGPSPLTDFRWHISIPVKRDDDTRMISKDAIEVKTTHEELTWKFAHFSDMAEELQDITTTYNQNSSEIVTSTGLDITTAAGISNTIIDGLNIKNITTATQLFDSTSTGPTDLQNTSIQKIPGQEQKAFETRGKLKFNVVTCENKSIERLAILEFSISVLEKNKGISFELPFNLSENALDFDEVSDVIYRTRAELLYRDDDRFVTITYNTTDDDIYVSTEIYGQQILAVVTKKISIWIIIGGSVGGLVLLIILGIILKKCGFFQRQKREDVRKWKRQSGYYANRQSRVSKVPAKIKSVNFETLNNDFSSFGKEEKKEKKLVKIKE